MSSARSPIISSLQISLPAKSSSNMEFGNLEKNVMMSAAYLMPVV